MQFFIGSVKPQKYIGKKIKWRVGYSYYTTIPVFASSKAFITSMLSIFLNYETKKIAIVCVKNICFPYDVEKFNIEMSPVSLSDILVR